MDGSSTNENRSSLATADVNGKRKWLRTLCEITVRRRCIY